MVIKYREVLNCEYEMNNSMQQVYAIASVIMAHNSIIGNMDLDELKTNVHYNSIRLCSVNETFKHLEKIHNRLITMHRDLHVRKELIKDMINECDTLSNETINEYDRLIDDL